MPSQPYLGQIMMCGFNYPPVNWAFCNGQSMSIAQYQALYTLIGTTYGGDGITTFNLPDLQGRVPLHFSATYVQGTVGGSAQVALAPSNVGHSHTVAASTSAGQADPRGNVPGGGLDHIFAARGDGTTLAASAVAPAGGNQPHENMQPALCVNFVIALNGIWPSQG